MNDPLFKKTVIFICEHDKHGAPCLSCSHINITVFLKRGSFICGKDIIKWFFRVVTLLMLPYLKKVN